MNSKKTSLTLGMAIALTLGIVIIFASPLSATTSIGSSSSMTMMLSLPPPSSSYSVQQQHGKTTSSNQDYMREEPLQAYKMIRMDNRHGLFLVYGEVV